MLKNIKNRFSKRKKLDLKLSPGEKIRDAMIEAGIKAAQESGYAAGNVTEQFVKIASTTGNFIDGATALGGGVESSRSLAKIAFKTTKDVARGDKLCTGLCLVAGTCETLALGCSTLKFIPFRGRIYVCAKIVSNGCMTYRNLCAGEGC
jgi:hypothetical protein